MTLSTAGQNYWGRIYTVCLLSKKMLEIVQFLRFEVNIALILKLKLTNLILQLRPCQLTIGRRLAKYCDLTVAKRNC